MAARKDKSESTRGGGPQSGFEGILKGLSDLVEKLGDLAEKGGELRRTGEIGKEDAVKGVYGFSVKVGGMGEGVKIEPFGNIRKDRTKGGSVVQEVREPMVDVFEETDHVLVVAEMPGIGLEDIRLDAKDDVLTIAAERGDVKYRKEILLPQSFPREKMKMSCKNGILRVKCVK